MGPKSELYCSGLPNKPALTDRSRLIGGARGPVRIVQQPGEIEDRKLTAARIRSDALM